MGLSSPNIPNANFSKTIKSQYIEICNLLKLVKDYNKLEINYNKLDGNTVDQLRKAIAEVSHSYSYPTIEKESVRNELKKIFVLNMSDVVDIDFAKLSVHEDEGVDYALILRNNIQCVLSERKVIVYNNMILNPTI